MTDKIRLFTILSLTSILIFSGFGHSPFAFSSGDDDDDDDWDDFKDFKKWKKDGKKHSQPNIESGQCLDPNNLVDNGCFESPNVNQPPNPKGWQIYPSFEPLPSWGVEWLDQENACEGFPEDYPGQLELQRGILGGPAEGEQHAELDSDCNGPNAESLGEELTSVEISQQTNVATTAEDEYKITFAYKARPGNKVPLSTNGLTVSWNGEEVPFDLQFSKKKWKYASATVDGIDGFSELKFEDTGNPDTLGTFLDDVSVLKIPKPVVTVILTKEIDNSADPTNPLVKNDPEAFDITLHVDDVPVPGTQIGADNPTIFPNIDPEGANFKITEEATNYIATIDGQGCPEVNDDTSSILLQPGDTLTCHILNTFVPPPVLTLKKALTNDNGGTAIPSDFVVKFWDENGPSGGNLVNQYRFNEMTSSVVITDLAPADYIITEELLLAGPDGDYDTVDDVLDTTSYTTVLVAGDTLCPSMENELFTLEIGNNITCTIYNDDNGGPPPTGGGDGIIFHRGTIEFTYNSINDDDGMFVSVTDINGNPFNCNPGETCISIDDPVMNSKLFTVQDPLINKQSSLVVLNIFALDLPFNESAFAQKCVVGTLLEGSTVGTLDFTFECETHEGIVSDPGAIPPINSLGKYRINYAVIDTEVVV